jgi:hypothetical protein
MPPDIWAILVGLGGLIIGAVGVLSKALDKGLSIREHEEFRNNINNRIDQVVRQYQRDDDHVLERLTHLEQTRPTTGELEARINTHRDETRNTRPMR